jgi:Arc/MetJ-type ribon-helix-helix transcriptional regulator
MSGLLNNPNLKKQPKTDPLDRGQDIKPKNTFTTDDLKSNNGKPSKLGKSVADSVTFYANVRINNHIKNKAEALSGIGLYKSQKDAIDNALDYLIDSLDAEDKRKFTFQLDILESRDTRTRGK